MRSGCFASENRQMQNVLVPKTGDENMFGSENR
jgi:hypothetical protein